MAILAAALVFANSDSCEGVPSKTVTDMCHTVAGSDPAMYSLCLETLRSSSLPKPNNKISTYASATAKAAAISCDSTASSIEEVLKKGLIGGSRHRLMWSGCVGDLRRAQQLLTTVQDKMHHCLFEEIKHEYVESRAMLEDCVEKLASVGPAPVRLHNSVKNTRDKTVLAFLMG